MPARQPALRVLASAYRPRRFRCSDGREARVRAVAVTDAPEILRAFHQLSDDSRYARFLCHKRALSPAALERGVHPVPGRDFVFVATTPQGHGFSIVAAAQYVRALETDNRTCEFAVTVAEDWRGVGLARTLLQSLLRRARKDGYTVMEGWVLAENLPMLSLARALGFRVEQVEAEASTVRVLKAL